jgi:hypothetical protein
MASACVTPQEYIPLRFRGSPIAEPCWLVDVHGPVCVCLQFLEAELKQSYAGKNYVVKNGLLELEKLYRKCINESADLAALWSDVTVLLVSLAAWGHAC